MTDIKPALPSLALITQYITALRARDNAAMQSLRSPRFALDWVHNDAVANPPSTHEVANQFWSVWFSAFPEMDHDVTRTVAAEDVPAPTHDHRHRGRGGGHLECGGGTEELLPAEVRWLPVGAMAVVLVSIGLMVRTIQVSEADRQIHRPAGQALFLLRWASFRPPVGRNWPILCNDVRTVSRPGHRHLPQQIR